MRGLAFISSSTKRTHDEIASWRTRSVILRFSSVRQFSLGSFKNVCIAIGYYRDTRSQLACQLSCHQHANDVKTSDLKCPNAIMTSNCCIKGTSFQYTDAYRNSNSGYEEIKGAKMVIELWFWIQVPITITGALVKSIKQLLRGLVWFINWYSNKSEKERKLGAIKQVWESSRHEAHTSKGTGFTDQKGQNALED